MKRTKAIAVFKKMDEQEKLWREEDEKRNKERQVRLKELELELDTVVNGPIYMQILTEKRRSRLSRL